MSKYPTPLPWLTRRASNFKELKALEAMQTGEFPQDNMANEREKEEKRNNL
jgi:hypothetical protein